MSTENFNKILVIGLGLIGGSFARACRKNNASKEIYAFDLDTKSLTLAQKYGVIDGSITNLEKDIAQFDLIALATPLSTYDAILEKILPALSETAIIIELGSVKDIEIKNEILTESIKSRFIPCHPIAGSDKTGFDNSDADLFVDKKFIICPEDTDEKALQLIEALATKIGAYPELIDAQDHNEIYALVSHLPQFLSFLSLEYSPKNITDKFFKKAFRLNDSDPDLWDEIFKLNDENMEDFYSDFFDNLADFVEKFEEEKFSEMLKDMDFSKGEQEAFDRQFLEDNFAQIFFRLVFAVSYLKVDGLESVKDFAGSGFKDFTSITSILHLGEDILVRLITKNQTKIFKLFESLE